MTITVAQNGKKVVIGVSGDFVRWQPDDTWREALAAWTRRPPEQIDIHNDGIGRWDSSLTVMIYTLIQTLPQTKVDRQTLPAGVRRLLNLALTQPAKRGRADQEQLSFLERLGDAGLRLWACIGRGLSFVRQVGRTVWRALTGHSIMRSVDFWQALDDCAPRAVGIIMLVSFLVGLILAFVGAIQLQSFGAQIYVASLVSIGMTRIMGAIMVGVMMAGRTGAAYAAALGTMQVNEELDALTTMGISRTDFLVLPRLAALVLAMPFLVILADLMGMVGGGAVGVFLLDLSPQEYWKYSVEAFHLRHFWIGLFHGFVFGIIIALCGCYFGIQCGRGSDSVGVATTRAVVYGVVWMIVATGLITWACEVMGI